MFVDHIKIYAKAGNGGNGSCSFRREKYVPKGGPDGGDGGRGSSIVLVADPHIDNLTPFFYEPILRAKNGANGMGKQKYGRSAADRIVKVPIGTVVYRLPADAAPFAPKPQEWEQGEEELEAPAEATVGARAAATASSLGDLEMIADLDRLGAELILCKGGDGGRGNIHFKSSRNRTPLQWEPGGEGEEGYFLLELRKIADAGLVGYPNAGKSTLLGKVSSAHPKIAPYPFTTLHPIVGVVDLPGSERVAVADIPGLVEGAHRNVGLGHEFLRHIVRCKLLLFVLDMAGTDGRNPIDDLGQLRRELELYDPTLAKRPWIIIANKMDDPRAEENLRHLRGRFRKREIIAISAELGEGIDDVKASLAKHLFPDGPVTQ
ncbi:MAG: GTPase ObgE [Chthoniobacteraceae bacterium]|nr:GTPase ObgE [Chthoniobacteraceae bacterium]